MRLVGLLVILRSWLKAESGDCQGDIFAEGIERVGNFVNGVAHLLCFDSHGGLDVIVILRQCYTPNGQSLSGDYCRHTIFPCERGCDRSNLERLGHSRIVAVWAVDLSLGAVNHLSCVALQSLS